MNPITPIYFILLQRQLTSVYFDLDLLPVNLRPLFPLPHDPQGAVCLVTLGDPKFKGNLGEEVEFRIIDCEDKVQPYSLRSFDLRYKCRQQGLEFDYVKEVMDLAQRAKIVEPCGWREFLYQGTVFDGSDWYNQLRTDINFYNQLRSEVLNHFN